MSSESSKEDGSAYEVTETPSVPLFQTSRTGFNDRAWNDPPSGLMNPSSAGVVLTTGVAKSSRPKLTGRVAFPLNSSQTAQGGQGEKPFTPICNPTGPPPTSGFVPQQSPPK